MFIAIRSIYKKYLQIFPRSEALCVACGCLANLSGPLCGLSGPLCGPLASVWPVWASVWPSGGHSRPVSVDLSAFSGLSLVIT